MGLEYYLWFNFVLFFIYFVPQGESGGAFKTFKGFSLISSAPAAGATFSAFGNGAGFKPLSPLPNGNAASVTPTFGGFNSPAATKTNTGEACHLCFFVVMVDSHVLRKR